MSDNNLKAKAETNKQVDQQTGWEYKQGYSQMDWEAGQKPTPGKFDQDRKKRVAESPVSKTKPKP